MASLECVYDVGIELTWVLHPTRWTVGGTSPYLGAVIANTAISLGAYALHGVAYLTLGPRVLKPLQYTDKIYAHFEVAMLTCAAHVVLDSTASPIWASIACAICFVATVGTRTWALKVARPSHYVPISSGYTFFLPQGTWRDAHVEIGGFLFKHLTLEGTQHGGLFHELGFTVALSIISGWIPRSNRDCASLSAAYGTVYFLMALVAALRRPYITTWDRINGVVSPLLTCIAILVAQFIGINVVVAHYIILVMTSLVTVLSGAAWVIKKRAPKEEDAIEEMTVKVPPSGSLEERLVTATTAKPPLTANEIEL